MINFPRLALVAALLAGASGVALQPVEAKKKDEAPAGPKMSPEFIKAAQPAQAALKGTDTAAMESTVAAAEAAAKTDGDKYFAGHMRVQVFQATMKANPGADQSVLGPTLSALAANPTTPPTEKAQYSYFLGQFAAKKRDYPAAIRYYAQARDLGYTEPQLPLLIAQTRIDSGDVAGGTADLGTIIKAAEASGKPAPESYYRYALGNTVKLKNRSASVDWLTKWVSAYPTTKTWHDALYIYGLQGKDSLATLDKGQTVDMFRLMRQNKALDQYGYEEYAQKVLDSGLPDEAKTVIAEGRTTGALPAGNANATAINAEAMKGIASEGSLGALSTKAKASATGNLASQTADAYLGKGDYASAIPLYRAALSKGVGAKADDVNTHLGIALALSGDKAGARTAFAAVTGPIRADIAKFWTVWLDHPATA